MVELARFRPSQPAPPATDRLRLVRLTDLRRLHWLLLTVVALEAIDLVLNLSKLRP